MADYVAIPALAPLGFRWWVTVVLMALGLALIWRSDMRCGCRYCKCARSANPCGCGMP